MSEVVGVWYVALWGGKVTAWLLCFCGESSYQKWEWNVYHDFIFVAAPLAVTDCYVFVFFFFRGAYLSAPLRRTNQAGGGIVSWFHWTFEMRWKAWVSCAQKVSPKGFWYKPKTWRLWEFILLYHRLCWVSGLDLSSLETQIFDLSRHRGLIQRNMPRVTQIFGSANQLTREIP